ANATAFSNGGLAVSTTYYYRIRATNSAGDSGYSNVASATTTSGGCTLGTTRCVAGNIAIKETCTAAGFAQSNCPSVNGFVDSACRPVCDLPSVPTVSTACIFAIGDGVNNGEYAWHTSDNLLAPPTNLPAAGSLTSSGSRAPVYGSGTTWPYAWSISTNDN